MNSQTLDVMFRKQRGEITAVFPSQQASRNGNLMCYAHLGQHSSCQVEWLRSTVPATPDDYADLLRELRGIYDGIELRVVKRRARAHRNNEAE